MDRAAGRVVGARRFDDRVVLGVRPDGPTPTGPGHEHRVRATRLPWVLMELHRDLAVGAVVSLRVERESRARERRGFTHAQVVTLRDVVAGAGFAIEAFDARDPSVVTIRATRARTLPDTVGPDLRVLVCGLNPSEYAADRGVGFARPGNRFWPAALASGLVTRDRDPGHALAADGVGMTDLVKRASARADVLGAAEYRSGVERLTRLVEWLRPRVVCFAGLAGYRAAVDRAATAGPVVGGFAGAAAYVMPNPSGVNAHARLEDLTRHLRAVVDLAELG